MGQRVNVIICDDNDNVGAVLYSNSSHSKVDAEEIVREIAEGATGPTEFTRKLLELTYLSAEGNNRAGDKIFSIDLSPGDHERLLRVTCTNRIKEGPFLKVTREQGNPDFEVKLHKTHVSHVN